MLQQIGCANAKEAGSGMTHSPQLMAVDVAETVLLEPSLDNSEQVGKIRHNIKYIYCKQDMMGSVFVANYLYYIIVSQNAKK